MHFQKFERYLKARRPVRQSGHSLQHLQKLGPQLLSAEVPCSAGPPSALPLARTARQVIELSRRWTGSLDALRRGGAEHEGEGWLPLTSLTPAFLVAPQHLAFNLWHACCRAFSMARRPVTGVHENVFGSRE